MRVDFSNKFKKQYEKAPIAVKTILKERLMVFGRDKYAPILNNHELKGKYQRCRSINVGGDWRAIFQELANGDIYFEFIGTHSQLYGK
ncbi:MAG: type II toxin-antitoxin system mRNA interferase toxin, RelE/StbE family [Minisyncoccales bacterium]